MLSRDMEKQRVLGLDSVRAVAALSVMLAHLAGPYMPGLSRYLFTGVPAVIVFFVVSGFCIRFPYRTRPAPRLAFWAARAVRMLVPALVAMGLAHLAGLREYNFVDGYILWSIVCELFYYAAYPLLASTARRIGWRTLCGASFVVSYAVAVGVGSDRYGNVHVYGWYLNWIILLPAWLLGCILADELKPEQPTRMAVWRYPSLGSLRSLIGLPLTRRSASI